MMSRTSPRPAWCSLGMSRTGTSLNRVVSTLVMSIQTMIDKIGDGPCPPSGRRTQKAYHNAKVSDENTALSGTARRLWRPHARKKRRTPMGATAPYRITAVEQLRARIGETSPLVQHKLWRSLEPVAIDFIHRSPFLLLATSDADGNLDVSPKGDGPGFVAVEDPTTILIPDRKGNKLIFGLQNILANPHVGLIFLIPGTGETLRVNGTAELTT